MMLLVEQPINHEYAHPPSFRNQSEYYCQKQKIPANFSTISSTINTTHLQYTSQGAPTYPFLQIVIVCISAPPGSFRLLLVLSTPEKHYQLQVFRIYKDRFEHKNTLQNYRPKKPIYTIQNESQIILSAGFHPHRK